jgi:hypothetical protein
MNDTKRSIRLLILAAACCFALVLIPVSSYAQQHAIVAQLGGVAHGVQQGVQKGAEGVQKGAEGTYNKGKEAITGENNQDQNQQQTEEQKATPSEENRMKPTQPGTETEQQNQADQNETEQNKSQTGETGQKHRPRTAGELPLLVMTGLLSLAGARATRRLK